MTKIIWRTVLGAVVGLAVYIALASSGGHDLRSFFLLLAWGIGMGNAFTNCIDLLKRSFHWATELSIFSFLTFGNGVVGLIVMVAMLVIILSLGWLYGWFLLVRGVMDEIR